MRYRTTFPIPTLNLGRELDRFMDETFGRGAPTPFAPATWTPTMDVTEDEAGLTIELEIPGIDPDAVEVTTDQGLLTIKGEKTATRHKEGVRALVSERSHGRFTRTLQLPQGADESKVEAEFSNGLLRIRVPRAALPQARKVTVKRTDATPAAAPSETAAN